MNSNYFKKRGRRVAGSWGRPGSKAEKRAASKGVRREPIDTAGPITMDKPDLETILKETGANSEFDLLVFMGD